MQRIASDLWMLLVPTLDEPEASVLDPQPYLIKIAQSLRIRSQISCIQ